MDIVCQEKNGIMLVILSEKQLDAGNATDFKRDITPVLEAHDWVVFDLSRLEFVDSSGLGALLLCLRHLHAKGGDLKLCGIAKPVRTLFELVRMHKLFHILDSSDDALHAFHS